MRSALLLSAFVVACAAAPGAAPAAKPAAPAFLLRDPKDDCTVREKFITKPNDRFPKECKAFGDFSYSEIIGCLAPNDEFFLLGSTYDYKQTAEMGYRFKCEFKDNKYSLNIDGCLMGKKHTFVETGKQGVAFNNICTCMSQSIQCK